MIFLLLAILCGTCISCILRAAEEHITNKEGMLMINYAVCSLLAFLFNDKTKLFPQIEGFKPALLIGIISGILYVAGFILFQRNIKRNGMVLSTTFMKLGVLVPTVLSLLIFKEQPRLSQILGVLIAVITIVWMYFEKDGDKITDIFGLIFLMLAGGFGDSMGKVFEQFSNESLRNQYLLYTFLSSLTLCIIFSLKKRRPVKREELFYGFLLGIPNYFSVRCLLLSLKTLPAIVVYPTYSAGTVALVCLVGTFLFHERLTSKQKKGIIFILTACICLNI